jgi:heat shock protein HslJ
MPQIFHPRTLGVCLAVVFFLTGCQSTSQTIPQTRLPTEPIPPVAASPTSAPVDSSTPAAPSQQAGPSFALEEQAWQLVTFVDAQGVTKQPIADTKITARFSDGQVGGSSGCNQYFASYRIDRNKLTIQNAGSTLMACVTPEGVMMQEQDYLNRLTEAASYQIEGERLEIFDSNGEIILTFSV